MIFEGVFGILLVTLMLISNCASVTRKQLYDAIFGRAAIALQYHKELLLGKKEVDFWVLYIVSHVAIAHVMLLQPFIRTFVPQCISNYLRPLSTYLIYLEFYYMIFLFISMICYEYRVRFEMKKNE